MRGHDWSFGGLIVSVTGGLLSLAPLYDIWDDLTNPPFSTLVSTLLENSVMLGLSLVLVGVGLWLLTNDWEDVYVRVTAIWFTLGSVAVLFAMGWVVAWQLFVQGNIKPYVLAADAVVLGAIGAVAVGLHTAQRRKQKDELETERDRLSALFENSSDAIASIEYVDGTPVIRGVNAAFADAFGIDRPDAPGNRLRSVVVPADADERVDHEDLFEQDTEREVVRQTPDGDRVFLRRVAPYGEGRAFASYTDVTERKELTRTREQRNKIASLHGYVSRLQRADTEDGVLSVAVEAVEDILDADTATLVADTESGERRVRGAPGELHDELLERARATDETRSNDGGTVMAAPGEGVVVQAVTATDRFTEADEEVLELLANHVSESIERVRREQEVQRERERLEFMNRILRHNLLNGLNVVEARLGLLEGRVEEGLEDHLETATGRVRNMIDLIETMRTFMQAIVEGEDHQLGPVSLRSVVEDELDSARGAFPEAEFDLEGVPDATVRADALLSEVFENLLTNAVRHNDKAAPRVTVRGEREDEAVAVEVADNGPGIPDDRKEEVFDKGIKGLQSPGSGFGLYLVKEILDSYGGEVTVEDNEPEGSVFRVRLPVANAGER